MLPSGLLEVMGIPVYISDGETKQLMMTDSCIRSELTALLGEEVYAGGVLNKSLLASYLFGSPEHAGQINGIVHPRVKEDFRQWVCQRAACRMAGKARNTLSAGKFTPCNGTSTVFSV